MDALQRGHGAPALALDALRADSDMVISIGTGTPAKAVYNELRAA